MKTNKLEVISKLKNVDTSKLHLMYEELEEFEDDIKELEKQKEPKDRVLTILNLMSKYDTFDEHDEFQCYAGANRSAVDIWRVYNYYFRPVSIFYIMRALYQLVIIDETVGTLFCQNIDKQVFVYDDCCVENVFIINDLGVRFAEWRTIGLGD